MEWLNYYFDINAEDLFIAIGVLVITWLIIRELRTWYWKINERIHLLTKINNNLIDIKKELRNEQDIEEDEKNENEQAIEKE